MGQIHMEKECRLTAVTHMKYDEIWAIETERIESFFRSNRGEAEIVHLPERKIGNMTLPQTRVIISGADAEEVHRKFVLHFVTAGG